MYLNYKDKYNARKMYLNYTLPLPECNSWTYLVTTGHTKAFTFVVILSAVPELEMGFP